MDVLKQPRLKRIIYNGVYKICESPDKRISLPYYDPVVIIQQQQGTIDHHTVHHNESECERKGGSET